MEQVNPLANNSLMPYAILSLIFTPVAHNHSRYCQGAVISPVFHVFRVHIKSDSNTLKHVFNFPASNSHKRFKC